MSRSAESIRDELLGQLMPQGWAWPKDGASNLGSLLMAIATSRASLEADIESLALEIAPGTSMQLLADYEAILGRVCCGEDSATLSYAQRQALAQARWIGRKVVSRRDYISLAAQMGFAIEVAEYAATRCGRTRCGDRLHNQTWDFAWIVRMPGYTPVVARSGTTRSGDRLMTWGNNPLRCEIEARNPAHLRVRFAQSGANLLSDFGVDITV